MVAVFRNGSQVHENFTMENRGPRKTPDLEGVNPGSMNMGSTAGRPRRGTSDVAPQEYIAVCVGGPGLKITNLHAAVGTQDVS